MKTILSIYLCRAYHIYQVFIKILVYFLKITSGIFFIQIRSTSSSVRVGGIEIKMFAKKNLLITGWKNCLKVTIWRKYHPWQKKHWKQSILGLIKFLKKICFLTKKHSKYPILISWISWKLYFCFNKIIWYIFLWI